MIILYVLKIKAAIRRFHVETKFSPNLTLTENYFQNG